MWEAISSIFTSSNAWFIVLFLLTVLIIGVIFLRKGLLSFNTGKLRLGADAKERDIIRQQVEWAHTYVAGLYSCIHPAHPVDDRYNGYFTKYILEVVYSEVVDWITFNHMSLDSDYISIKQAKIKSLIYGYDVTPEYRTPKFEKQVDEWVAELIKKLILIRQVYK